ATRNISIHTGLDYQNDDVGESTPDGNAYDETSRDNTGVFVSAGFDNNIATAEASVRYDDNESFGDFTTYGLGAGYRVNSLLKVNASLATGFKTPTFNDLYYPDYGNPDAEPETYTTKSISATLTPNRQVKAIATLYRTEVDDPLNVNNDSVENGDDSRITGKELTVMYTESNLELAATHESLDPENKDTGKDLRFIARQKTTASATYSINQLSAGIDIENVGKRYKDNDNEVELDSYTLVHLNAGYDLQKDLKLAFSVKNVTDENYVSNQTYGGDDYNVEGRTFFGSVRYRF
ncbi:TonB-dependent receptor, partial [Oceanospirillum sp. HFRX-1_2]